MNIWAEIVEFQAKAGSRGRFALMLLLLLDLLGICESIRIALEASLNFVVRPASIDY